MTSRNHTVAIGKYRRYHRATVAPVRLNGTDRILAEFSFVGRRLAWAECSAGYREHQGAGVSCVEPGRRPAATATDAAPRAMCAAFSVHRARLLPTAGNTCSVAALIVQTFDRGDGAAAQFNFYESNNIRSSMGWRAASQVYQQTNNAGGAEQAVCSAGDTGGIYLGAPAARQGVGAEPRRRSGQRRRPR